jgi:hypothetical protein
MINENELTKFLIVGSRGELVVYEPTPDIEGIDRLVKLRGDFDPIGIQIKGTARRVAPNVVSVNIKVRTFVESRYNFVAVLEFDEDTYASGPFLWFIRTDELAKLAVRKGGLLNFRASADPDSSRDKYLPWRYHPEEVACVVETAVRLLDERGHKAELPAKREHVERECRRLGVKGLMKPSGMGRARHHQSDQ